MAPEAVVLVAMGTCDPWDGPNLLPRAPSLRSAVPHRPTSISSSGQSGVAPSVCQTGQHSIFGNKRSPKNANSFSSYQL